MARRGQKLIRKIRAKAIKVKTRAVSKLRAPRPKAKIKRGY